MKSHSWLVVVLAMVPVAQAQPFTPRIGYVYPAGGQQGATAQVTLGGQYLDGVTNAHVSGTGVRAQVVEHVKPMTQQQFNALRQKLQELQEKRQAIAKSTAKRSSTADSQASTNLTWTAEDDKMIAQIRKGIAAFARRPMNPAIAETVTLQVTMAPEAEPGDREIRLGTPAGLSNPLVFCVGELPEFRKKGAHILDEPPLGRGFRRGQEQRTVAAPSDLRVTPPVVVNGQIMPGGVDRYRFQARKGQQLVIAVSARQLIPYLADAVPGWFQPTLTLFDAQGKELAYDDDYRFHPDPVLHCDIPRDGEYVIEIKDAIYRGREDFVYRIAIGELPFVTGIFPLGGKVGAPTAVALNGWNLPATNLTQEAKEPGLSLLSVQKDGQISNRLPFAADTLPECLEQEPNNAPAGAQKVAPPIIVNGRIGQSGDTDVFLFEGRAGDEIIGEVLARRLDSPLDSTLRVTDATGRQLAFNDDHEDKGSGLNTHHADSWLTVTLPADGTYYLHLSDAQRKGGGDYAYRLRISPPRPDFELRVVPASISVRGGATVAITVYALRKDGFSGPIDLELEDGPPGFILSGARVPAKQDQVRLTLTTPPKPSTEPFTLHLEGRAAIHSQEIFRRAVPAEDMMQAFAYRHLVPAQELKVAVSSRWMARSGVKILETAPVAIPVGGTARVRIGVPGSKVVGNPQFELSDPPEGISIQTASPNPEGAEIVLQCDAAKVRPGLQGNLIVNAFAPRAPVPANAKPQGIRPRTPLGTLPAIPFEIVEASKR